MDRAEASVREKLLEAGKREFLELGYEKASLRRICDSAGVTTGALYFWFQNKADLFEQIVSGTVIQMQKLSEEMIRAELEDASVGVDNEKLLLDFLWRNREVILILMDKAAGTGYEGFMENICRNMEDVFISFFEKYGCRDADRDLVHLMVGMKMKGYRELVSGGYTLERTLELAEKLGWYTDGGFEALMEKLNIHNGPRREPDGPQNSGM